MFHNPTHCETPVQKMRSCVELNKSLTYFEILHSNSDTLLKTCFKIWFFSKVLKGNWFFFHSFHQLMVFEKTHNCKSWRLHGLIRSKKVFFWKQNIHQSLFCTNQFHFKNSCGVKHFFSEIWHVLKFSIRNLSSCEKMALSLTLWNSWFKIWRVVQKMIQKLITFKTLDY